MNWDDSEKEKLFKKISFAYFERNFGSMSKSDLETLLFSEYIEHHIRHRLPYDDYTLSKELGITQARIRTLKERKELKYPYKDFKWQSAFAEAVAQAKYDETDHYVKMIIQDVNVMAEVRHYIELRGWFDECSLNKKLLRIPMDCFVEICFSDTTFDDVFTKEAKANIRKIKNEESCLKDFLIDFSVDGLKAFLMSASQELILQVLPLLPFGGTAKVAFEFVRNIIEKGREHG